MEGWWCRVVWTLFLLHICSSWISCSEDDNNDPMWEEPFEGVDDIKLIGCKTVMASDFTLVQLNFSSTTLVAWVKDRGTCTAPGSNFASCVRSDVDNTVTLKAIITDLQDGETRDYKCSVLYVSGAGNTRWTYHNITVSYTPRTTVTSETATTTETTSEQSSKSTGGGNDGFQFPSVVVIIILVLMIVLAIVCCVLLIRYYKSRRRRKRRSADCGADTLSVRSGMTDKSFYPVNFQPGAPMAGGTLRYQHQSSLTSASPAPNMTAPEVPGNNLVMQYQKPSDSVLNAGTLTLSADRGYASGNSAHYHEPWGRPLQDPEILGKLDTLRSPNRNLVKIPDFEASSSAPYPDPATLESPSSSPQDNE